MATKRDTVWTLALTLTIKRDQFVRPAEIAESHDVSERTVRDVLNQMSRSGWLTRDVMQDGRVRFGPPEGVSFDA